MHRFTPVNTNTTVTVSLREDARFEWERRIKLESIQPVGPADARMLVEYPDLAEYLTDSAMPSEQDWAFEDFPVGTYPVVITWEYDPGDSSVGIFPGWSIGDVRRVDAAGNPLSPDGKIDILAGIVQRASAKHPSFGGTTIEN